MTAAEIFAAAFYAGRPPRSPEYRDGMLKHLRYGLGEAEKPVCPHAEGTAAFDAWFAGVGESWLRLEDNGITRPKGGAL